MLDLIGNTYRKYPTDNSKFKATYGLYQCSYCENTIETQAYFVKTGRYKSCGCKRGWQVGNTPVNKSEYDTDSPLYYKWESMIHRVRSNKPSTFACYGDKGIRVCSEWVLDFGAFQKWSLENGYDKDMVIHRIDNDSDYSPDNCEYVTKSDHTIHHNKERDSYKHMLRARGIR